LQNSARERKWRPSIPAQPAGHRRIGLTRLPQRLGPGVAESPVQAVTSSPALPPVPCRSDSGNARFSDAGFQNFSYDAWDVDSAGSHDRQYDRCRVEFSLARFVAITDVVPTAKEEKMASAHPKKTGKPDLGLTYNDVVFRPNRGYDSEVQGRQISFDKNQELTRADA
jgi:hypothetical protein